MEKKWFDNELGTITLRINKRCRRYSLKIAKGVIVASMPLNGVEQTMRQFIEQQRPRLIKLLKNQPKPSILDPASELQAATFRLKIECEDRPNYKASLKDGVLAFSCPLSTNFSDDKVQLKIKELLKNVCRHEAKRILPGRLDAFAQRYGFTYTGVKITSSRTRWGSCTSRKSINLSLYLMLLPYHLIDYVLLHELCHTMEMNHSDRFWVLMDKVTNSQAKAFRKELKGFHIP